MASAAALAQPYDDQPPPADDYGPPPPDSGAYSDPYDASDRARAEDEAYERTAEDWAERYCYRRGDNAAAGAVIGGVLGAFLGSGIAGRGHHTTGAVIGGATGAVAGAAIGSSSTSPGCPPGYAVRSDAPPLYFSGFSGGYAYAAPADYKPWIWYHGRWTYRTYPYHRYWSRNHRRDPYG
jgi:hypothetical protein